MTDDPQDGKTIVDALRGHLQDDAAKCDVCSGNFTIADLYPVSGDVYLCGPCLRKYMEPRP